MLGQAKRTTPELAERDECYLGPKLRGWKKGTVPFIEVTANSILCKVHYIKIGGRCLSDGIIHAEIPKGVTPEGKQKKQKVTKGGRKTQENLLGQSSKNPSKLNTRKGRTFGLSLLTYALER